MNGPGPAPGLLDDAALKPFLKPDDVSGVQGPLHGLDGSRRLPGGRSRPAAAAVGRRALLAGTDTPNPGTAFGAAMHSELELLVRAGLTPIEALRAATSIPPEKFSLPERGRIRPGAAADLVLVEGDPTVSIKGTRKIVGVWKGGRPVDREAYRAGVADAVRAAQNAPAGGYGPSGLIADFRTARFPRRSARGGWSRRTLSPEGSQRRSWNGRPAARRGAGGPQDQRRNQGRGGLSPGPAPLSPRRDFDHGPGQPGRQKGRHFLGQGERAFLRIELFARSRGFRPVAKNFTVGSEWKEIP